MSKGYLSLLAALSVANATAAPSDLFFSEYVEGSSNNKALEIANTSDQAIDLSSYQIQMYFNGSASAGLTIDLGGEVAANDVFVIALARAEQSILDAADQTQGSGWFNGDDAIVLLNNGVIIDSIGQIGNDPGSEWGQGEQSTQDNTLRRNADIDTADQDAMDAFDPSVQWQGFARNAFDGLGSFEVGEPDDDSPLFACFETATPINLIQGEGNTTPMNGVNVHVEGIVVGDFQGSDGLRGFFLQEEASDYDANSNTSEGIFVYDNNFGVDVNVGDQVRVAGRAGEYSGMTQISSVTDIAICSQNNSVVAKPLSLPLSSASEQESYEGMLVTFEQTLTVSENYNLGRYGELVLSNGRLFNPTNIVAPGEAANQMQASNDLNRIILDDGSSRQNPQTIIHPQPELSAFNTVRGGDNISGLVAVMHQSFGAYRLHAVQAPNFETQNVRSFEPTLKDSPLKVASFNVLNYFNGDGNGAGYPTPRGADNAEEFTRQRAKIINAIAAMDADVIGLMEIENDGFDESSAIADLVNGLNQATGKRYAFVDPQSEQLGTDAITVGMIYNTDVLVEVGTAATLDSGAFADRNRQPLVQSFREKDSNGVFTLVVNHFKSKGSCPSDSSDLNAAQGDGQGCWNHLRTEAAEELKQWLDTNPTSVSDNDILVIGDLNAYAMEDPVIALEQNGLVNMLKKFEGTQAYSYVFYGQAGSLDHALASDSLEAQVIDASEWHINTDEPSVLDYNTEYKSDTQIVSLYSTEPFRASDHDPVIVGLDLTPSKDVNNDGRISVRDLIAIARNLRKMVEGKNRKYDLNQDKDIDFRDILIILREIHRNRKTH